MKRAMAAATLVLVTGGLAGCGGSDSDSDSGSDASTSASASASASDDSGSDDSASGSDDSANGEFCSAFTEFGTALSGLDPTAADADVVKAIKDAVDELSDVDLPSDIPQDAEDGFNKVVSSIEDLPDDATAEDLSNIQADFSAEDKANATAFNTYLASTCPDLTGGGASSDTVSPSAPTESPS